MSTITLPGVIMHAITHRFFCDIAKVPVYSVNYFQLDNTAECVVHGEPKNLKEAFLISIGPLIANTILCALISFNVAVARWILNISNVSDIFYWILWLGLSIGMHAFPSDDAAESLSNAAKNDSGGSVAFYFLSKIMEYIIKTANFLNIVWFDLIYAVIIAGALPFLLFH